MKTVYVIISAIVVGIIAYLLAHEKTVPPLQVAPALMPPAIVPPAATPPPPATGSTTTVLTVPPVATGYNSLTASGSNVYAANLPAPYNTMPVVDFFSGLPPVPGNDAYVFRLKSLYSDAIKSIVPATATTDDYMKSYLLDQEGTLLKFIVNRAGTLIYGTF
jgi:hypothetical protein